jgi:hypothetical protein
LKSPFQYSNEDYAASLERHKIYRVLPDPEAGKDGDIRIIDESGEDYLYPKNWFVLITVPDALIHAFWLLLDQLFWILASYSDNLGCFKAAGGSGPFQNCTSYKAKSISRPQFYRQSHFKI